MDKCKKKSWTISSKDHVPDDDDDDDVVQHSKKSLNRLNEEPEEEEEEQTLKAGNTLKTAGQTMLERKMQQADARVSQAIRSNALEATQNRQRMHENASSYMY